MSRNKPDLGDFDLWVDPFSRTGILSFKQDDEMSEYLTRMQLKELRDFLVELLEE